MAEDSKLRVSRASTSYPSGAAAARATNSDPLVELARLIGQDQIANASRDGGQGGSSANPQVPASERLEAATRELSRTLGLRASQREFGSAPAAAPRGEAARQTSPRQTSPRNEPPTVRDEPVEPGHVRYEDEDFNDAPRTVAPRADAPVRAEAIRSEPVRVETPHPRTTPVAHSAYAVEAHEHDPRYAAVSAHDAYEPAYTDTAYAEGHPQADASYDYADEGPLPQERKRKGVMAVAAVLGLVLVGTAGAYAYRAIANATSGPPPVIKADAAPAKIVPEQQKGEASQPRVSFDRNDKNQIERLLTREEQPIDMKDPRLTPRAAQSNTAGSAAGAQSANPNEPKKVRTVAIRPDGSVMPDASRPTALDPSRGLPPVPRAPSIPAPRPGQVALAPSGAPATTGSAPSNPALPRSAVPAGSHVVQLTSQRSEAEAQSSYRVLQSRYPSVLGSRQPLIRRVELGDRGTYYRAQVGPFASADEANELCTSLKAAGGQCIVQRN